MFGEKKPKFKFSFTINDLSRIPHTSGYCHTELTIADGRPTGVRASLSQFRPFSLLSKESAGNELLPVAAETQNTQALDPAVSGHSSSRSIHVRTSRYRIHNFKCHFNLSMTCNLRFPLRRKDNMVGDKYLVLRVFYHAERHTKHDHAVELGVVTLNLAAYLNFNAPVTAKYLLQDSKINSILNVTTSFEELPADFDFHTQLRMDDTRQNQRSAGTGVSFNKASENSDTKLFKVPQFQRQAVFGSLDGVIGPQADCSKDSERDQDMQEPPSKSDKSAKSNGSNKSVSDHNDRYDGHERKARLQDRYVATVGTKQIEDVIVDPIIGSLYRKILESPWDPDVHALLKLTPQQVVDGIFDKSGDASKMGKNLQYQNLKPQGSGSENGEDNGVKNADRLIAETKFRSNLTSWSVSWA